MPEKRLHNLLLDVGNLEKVWRERKKTVATFQM
jgi:hypothetical protein